MVLGESKRNAPMVLDYVLLVMMALTLLPMVLKQVLLVMIALTQLPMVLKQVLLVMMALTQLPMVLKQVLLKMMMALTQQLSDQEQYLFLSSRHRSFNPSMSALPTSSRLVFDALALPTSSKLVFDTLPSRLVFDTLPSKTQVFIHKLF